MCLGQGLKCKTVDIKIINERLWFENMELSFVDSGLLADKSLSTEKK